MEAVGIEFKPNGLVSGHQTLGDDLPPKNPLLGHQTVAHKGECIGLARRHVLEHFGKAGHGKSLLRGFGQREPGEKDGKVITRTLVEIINGLPRVEIH